MLEAEKNAAFEPFHVLSQFRNAGVLWLRFTLAPTPNSDAAQSLAQLDLGKQIPDQPQVWIKAPGREVQSIQPGSEGLYSLHGLMGGGEVYIRLEGMPGLWFTPLLITPAEAYSTLPRQITPLTLAALSVLLLLCFLRSMLEHGDWRFWAGVFASAALVQAIWGIPSTPHGRVLSSDMPGILAAGIALMLLPHVGRHIMRTRSNAPFTDVLLLVLALPGAALALLPLLPGMAWTARLVTLWPLGAALCLLPALGLRVCGVPGSGLFFLACLGMTAGTAVGLVGIGGALETPLYGMGPLLGVTFATLLIAAAAPRDRVEESDDENLQLHTSQPQAVKNPNAQPLLIKGQMPTPLGKNTGPHPATASGVWADQGAKGPNQLQNVHHLEEVLRPSLDHVLHEACLVDQCLDLPGKKIDLHDVENARRHADALVAATRELASQLTDIPRTLRKAESRRPAPVKENAAWAAFNLQRLVIQLIEEYREEAEAKGLALAWHIAPYVPFHYRGDSERLRDVLALLLSDAIRATERGSICLRVRRDEQSANPGHLLFNLVDTGLGAPPLQRNALALARMWELTSEHEGSLNIESSPQGMDISFTLRLVALGADNNELPVPPTENATVPAEPQFDRIIVASSVPLNRQLLAFYLEGQGQTIWEARDADEAVSLYQHTPTGLIVLDGHLPEDDIIAAVAHIRVLEGEYSLPTVPILALTLNEEQAERLHQAGCDHSLPLPVGRSEFRAMAMYLTNPSQERRQAKRRYAATHSFAIPKKTPEASPAPLNATHPATASSSRTFDSESLPPLHIGQPNAKEATPDNALVLPPAPAKGKGKATLENTGHPATDIAAPPLEKTAGEPSSTDKRSPERKGFDPSRVGAQKTAKKSWLSSLFSKPEPEPLHVETYSELDESVGTPVPVAKEEHENLGTTVPETAPVSTSPAQPGEAAEQANPGNNPLARFVKSPETAPAVPVFMNADDSVELGEPQPHARGQELPTLEAPRPASEQARTAAPASGAATASQSQGQSADLPEQKIQAAPTAPTLQAAQSKLPHSATEPALLAGLLPPWSQEDSDVLSVTQLGNVSASPVAFFAPLPSPGPTLNVPNPHAHAANVHVSASASNGPDAAPASVSDTSQGLIFVNPTPLLAPQLPLSDELPPAIPQENIPPVPALEPMPTSEKSEKTELVLNAPAQSEPEPELVLAAPLLTPEPLPATEENPEPTPENEPDTSESDISGAAEKKDEQEGESPAAEASFEHPSGQAAPLDSKPAGKLEMEREPAPVTARKPVPFLSLDPLRVKSAKGSGSDSDDDEDIVDLTEDQLIEPLLVQQIPELIRSLDAAMEHAHTAFANQDAWALSSAAARMADRAVAFGLHGLADLARCTEEAARHGDLESAGQLLPEVQAEIERNRR